MNLKQKVKTYSFWISLVSAVLIVLRIIGEHFGWFINESFIMDIVTGICGILVLLGILSSPTNKEENMEETINNLKEQSEQIQTQQKELNQTIKQDVEAKQLTIEEQIALLKQNAQKQTQTAEKTTSEEIEKTTSATQVAEETQVIKDVEETIQATDTFGLVYVPETEVIAPFERVENTQATTSVTEQGSEAVCCEDTTEEVILGVEMAEQPAVQTQSYAQTMQTELAEPETQTVLCEAEQSVAQMSAQLTEVAAQPLADVEMPASNVETVEETTTNFTKLSNDELKQLLIEVLQRL